jgi:AcrR family transcriptional regulator
MVRVMPVPDLRERNRTATRRRILEAVHGLLVEEHPAALSMPVVAERAGVGVRTLYRYFPSKEALLDAASMSMSAEAMEAVGGDPTWDTLGEYLRVAWRGFGRALPAVKAQHLTPGGRELRARRLPLARQMIREGLLAEGLDLPEDELEALVDLVVLLSSSAAYLELADRLGHADDDAARLALWAIESLIERARRDGGVAR